MIPLVVCVEDLEAGGQAEQFAFIKSPVRIGRGELNDLPLSRPFVSTYHGLVQFDDASASYVDVGSTNGSVLGGVQVERNVPAPIATGSDLLIGTFRLTFTRRATAEHVAVPKHLTAFAERLSMLNIPRVDAAPLAEQSRPTHLSGAHPIAGPAERTQPRTAHPIAEYDEPVEPSEAHPIVEPERPIEPAEPDPIAVAEAEAAIGKAQLDLEVQYLSYAGALQHLRAAAGAAMVGLGDVARDVAMKKLAVLYPGSVDEPRVAPPEREPSVAPARAEPPVADAIPVLPPPPLPPPIQDDLGAAALKLLSAFTESYLGEAPLETARDVELALGRVADVLETFGRSFVELQHGYEEFGSEMGVRVIQGDGAIHRARDAHQLLSYLLDHRGEGRERELQRAFADFMLHQVALLRGVVAGGRALLALLSPDAVAASAPRGVWPLRCTAMWKAFEETFHELADEDSALTQALFGKEFARAYAAIVGGCEEGEAGPPRRRQT